MVGMFAGTVSSYRGRLQLVHPEYELLPGAPPNADLTPRSWPRSSPPNLSRSTQPAPRPAAWLIGRSVQAVIGALDAGEDPLPAGTAGNGTGLCGQAEAIRAIHRPLDWADRDRARLRLKWDEAFRCRRPGAGGRRRGTAGNAPAARRRRPRRRFDARLPFTTHRRSAGGRRNHRGRPRLRLPHAPAAPRRGRLGQDGDRHPGHAPGRRRGRPGRTAGPHRSPGPAALPVDHRHARPAGPARPAGRRGARHRWPC